MRFVALVGSLRKESINMKLARTIQERFQDKFELDILDIASLPHFDQDMEKDPPEAVREFKAKLKQADGVIIVTPEYNWSVPGVLKNALDWTSREDQVLIGKPVMIAGATPGMMGTIRAQLHLRQILSSPGIQAKVLPAAGNELLVNLSMNKFSGDRLTDEPTLQHVDAVVHRFIDFASA